MKFTGPSTQKLQPLALAYGMAVAAVIIATLLRVAVAPLTGAAVPFLTYFVGSLFVVWYYGLGPALLNIAISAAVGAYLFISSSTTSPFYGGPGSVARVSVVGYVTATLAASFLVHIQRRTLERVRHEMEQRKQAERELSRVQGQLKDELSGMRRLHELGTRLMQQTDLGVVLGEILSTAELITGADMGNIQLLGSDGVLRIEAQHGFSDQFLEFFSAVKEGENSACATALSRRERVVIEDVARSEILAGSPVLPVLLAEGTHAVQCTPMSTRTGDLVGMLSTHYREPRRLTERDLRLLDLLARQAADLIEKLRAEDALRESEERYRATFDNAAVGIAHVALDGRWVRFNDATCTITGYSREELIHKTFGDITHPDDLEADWILARRVAAGEVPTYSLEKRYIRKDGSVVWVNLTVSLVRDASGAPLHYVSVIEDINARKLAEEGLRIHGEQLHLANTALARSNDDLQRFAFAASHDLQEPLRMISVYSQLLVKSYPGQFDERAGMYVANIVDGTTRMRELLEDLLAYTQVGVDPGEPAEVIDLKTVLEDAEANLMASIEETGASITSDELPPLYAHRSDFTSLFQNLIGNAIKYRSEQPPRIHVSAQKIEDEWHFSIADNGIGIDPEYHQQIFEVFKRLHGRTIPGTGIGLPICKRVIERYGGRMWVASREGQGATFYFALPAVAVQAAATV
ncbi:MAG TPA: PAS domain S-box protein [Bryobacteraceae bacterium]|nr:PAS domain S-box protein [Bryobacteraceae bacterium]